MEIVGTRGQILMAKCTKIDFGWGSAPDPAEGAYDAPADLLVGWGGYPLPMPYPLRRLAPHAFGVRLPHRRYSPPDFFLQAPPLHESLLMSGPYACTGQCND